MMKFQRGMACLLALFFCLSAAGMMVSAANQTINSDMEEIDQYIHDFESALPSDHFSDNATGFGMSFAGSVRAQVVGGADAIDGRSVRFSGADLRWWSVHYTGMTFGFSVDVLCDEGFKDTELYWGTQNHIGSTTTESFNGGRVITVKADENGEPAVYNYDNEKLTNLTRGRTARLSAIFAYGEPGYTVYMDGQPIAEGNRFAEDSAIYAVYGLKLTVESRTETSYITVDNLRAYTEGKKYPQPNSYQAPGEVPAVTLPDALPTEGVMVYANETYVATVPRPDTAGEAPLLPLVETLSALGASASVLSSGQVDITTPTASFTLTADGRTLCWNEETVTLNTPVAVFDGTVCAPAQLFAEVAGAKVWYAEALGMVVISTGSYTNDHVLRSIGGSFWMDGEPYYEISFNKWDLSAQIAADPSFNDGEYVSRSWCTPETTLAGAERALRELSENGFKTIRIFASNVNPGRGQAALDRLFAHTDLMYDLCDKYGIRVIPCLGLMDREFLDGQYVEGAGWVSGTETYYDLITDPASRSRAWVYEFIDLYINRYKDRDTILMWEIQNEGNLGADVASGVDATYSILQLGAYYADVTARIKTADPSRLVTGGDSLLRSAQWHLFTGVMAGMEFHDWNIDKDYERLNALYMINHGVDVVSVHGYSVGYKNGSGHAYYLVQMGNRYPQKVITWKLLMDEARRIGMPLYNGECGGMVDPFGKEFSADNVSPEAAEARVRYLETLVDAGVQLTHWWTFNSDRVDFGMDMDTWNVTIKDTPETFAAIKSANEALQARYTVNPLAGENTHTLSNRLGDGTIPAPESESETESEFLTETERETAPVTETETVTETAAEEETLPATESIDTLEELTDTDSETARSIESETPEEASGCASLAYVGPLVFLLTAGVGVACFGCRQRQKQGNFEKPTQKT